MDRGLFIQLSVLDVLVETTSRVHAEDVQEAGMIVEWIAVNAMRRLFSGQNEDGTSLGVGFIGLR